MHARAAGGPQSVDDALGDPRHPQVPDTVRVTGDAVIARCLLLLAVAGALLAGWSWAVDKALERHADLVWVLLACAVLCLGALRLLGRCPRLRWRLLLAALFLLVALSWVASGALLQGPDALLLLLSSFGLVLWLIPPGAGSVWSRVAGAIAAAPLLALALVSLLALQGSSQSLLYLWLIGSACLLGVPGLQQALRHSAEQAQRPAELALLLQSGVAVLALAGWLLQSAVVVQAGTDKVPMQFNTASSILLAALALWAVLHGRRTLGCGLAAVVALIAALALSEELGWLPFSLGELAWRHPITSEQVDPGRMASNTAIALLVAALGTWLAAAAQRRPSWWPLSWICGMLVALAALAVLAGFALALPQARALGDRTPMALLTACALLAAGAALTMAGRGQDLQRHQQVWLPLLVLCGAVVLTLQVGRAVSAQRTQLAAQTSQLRADALQQIVAHGLQLRFDALQRMADRLSVWSNADLSAPFHTDARLYRRDFPSLLDLALAHGELGAVDPAARAPADFAWSDHAAALHALVTAARSSGDAQLSPPLVQTSGTHIALLAIPLDDAQPKWPDPAVLLASIQLDRLGMDLIGTPADLAVELSDGATRLHRHGLPAAGEMPRIYTLPHFGRSWSLRIWATPQPALDRITLALLLVGLLTGLCAALLVRYTGLAVQRAQESAASHLSLLKQIEHNEEMRAALDQSEHELSSALGSMSDALMLLDPDWRFVYVNEQAGKLTQRDPTSLLGQVFWEEFPETVGSVFELAYLEAVEQQHTVFLESYYAPLDGWFEVRAYPHRRGLAIYFRSITASKRVEQEQLKLRLETERAQRLARLGSWEVELPNGRLHCSPLAREILGLWAQLELTERRQLHAAVHPDDLAAVTRVHAQVASGEVLESDHSFRVRLEDGSVRILHEIVARVAAFEDRPALLSGAIQDISELRAAERGLRQAVESLRLRNRELQEFAFVASHDLQEPLRKIRTFADRLQHRSSVLSDPAALHDTERMTAAAARMQRLIEDLLAFSRVSQSTPNMCEVNLDHVLAAVLDDLSEVIQQRAAHIDSSPLPTLRADATQMRQLLQNLLSNALKFTSPERAPHIRLSASMQLVDSQPVWTLVCEDNGIGFDLKHAERIFTPFQRLHGREVFEGTGIGLAIVRRIVERHGGSVAAHGQPGVGACFTVVLPQGSSQLSE